MFRSIRLALVAVFSMSACSGQAVVVDVETPNPAPASRDASGSELVATVERALRYIDVEADRWMEGEVWVQEGSGCVSCHHVAYALWSRREAERAGIRLASSGFEDLRERAVEFLDEDEDRAVTATQMILAEEHGTVATETLRETEGPDGVWRARGQFPYQRRGEAEGDGVATLWALNALHSIEPLDEKLAARQGRALAWLDKAEDGVSNEWTSARLVVEHQRSDAARAAAQLERLVAAQHEDGGWGWLVDDPSNPFSTGVALYALSIAAPERGGESIRRGVSYLLERQQEDGTWITSSEHTSETASEDRDYIYRFWGTAWAAIGLSRAAGLGHGEDPVGRQASADEGNGGGDHPY